MDITASMVKELRETTGAGMMDCKKALNETDGDMEKAVTLLREKGLAAAAKKADRIAAEGLVESYIHMGGRVGVLLELNCETDFVAKTDDFKELAHDIALHIAAANPLFITREEVDPNVVEKEREMIRAQALNEPKPKPANIIDKMVDGRIEKYYKEIVLMEQPYVKDPDVTIAELITQKVAKIGEKISIRRFARYELGEGMEKREDNFAEEVMSQMNG